MGRSGRADTGIILAGVAQFGPEQGSLIVKTYCDGVAARAGHDLVIEVTRWRATLEFDRVELTADPRSLRVREGMSGVKPLTEKDRDEIQRNIDAKVLHGKPITFSAAVINHGDRLDVDGALTIAGAERGTLAAVELSDGRATTTMTLRQSDWGITPYRGLMGALKVRDEIEVELDVRWPAP
jgi:polyisoprenoid-binding protein YceI